MEHCPNVTRKNEWTKVFIAARVFIFNAYEAVNILKPRKH
jgi:hypothetical protein